MRKKILEDGSAGAGASVGTAPTGSAAPAAPAPTGTTTTSDFSRIDGESPQNALFRKIKKLRKKKIKASTHE